MLGSRWGWRPLSGLKFTFFWLASPSLADGWIEWFLVTLVVLVGAPVDHPRPWFTQHLLIMWFLSHSRVGFIGLNGDFYWCSIETFYCTWFPIGLSAESLTAFFTTWSLAITLVQNSVKLNKFQKCFRTQICIRAHKILSASHWEHSFRISTYLR